MPTTTETTNPTGPLVVKIPVAMMMLSVSRSRLYDLMDAGEVDSLKDGKARKITTASILAYITRQVAASKAA